MFLGIVAAGAWLAVIGGALTTSFELALSGVPLGTVLPPMLGVHALIGVGEAVVTVAAVSAVLAGRADLVAAPPRHPPRDRTLTMRRFTILALAVAIGLAAAASPFASGSPDGLERVAADEGFLDRGTPGRGPVPDYAAPGVSDSRVATGLAGFGGTLLLFGLASGAGALVRRRGAPQ